MGCVPKVGLCTQSLALYEATGQAKWLRKSLPGIDNGRQHQYTIRVFSLLWQHVKCAAKHFDGELYVAKEKIQNHMKVLSIKVSGKCLWIRLLKVYRPSRHEFYGRPTISGLLKGPKKG